MRKQLLILFSVLIIGAMILSACGTPETIIETVIVEKEGETIIEIVEVEVEAQPEVEVVTRTGAWIDTVIFVEEPSSDSAVTRMMAGDIDLYAFSISEAPIAERIYAAEELSYYTSYGSYNEITFNPVLILEDGSLNPFGDPQIREAMNWLMDRDYICQEISGGMAVPRFVPINLASADRAKLADIIAEMEIQYAYNPEKAEEVISARMVELGAELVDGVWTFNGEPVEIVGLIRIEDERLEIGDYLSNQLEDIGFTVTRDYKTSAEASTCWISSEPGSGCFNFYTGGWVSTTISRDEAFNFGDFYTPLGWGIPLWQAYDPSDEFFAVADALYNSAFDTNEERTAMLKEAIPLAMADSARIWLKDDTGIAAQRADLTLAADLSGSTYGATLWPHTLKYDGQVGGEVTIGMPSLMTQAWNPVAGSNWVYDMMPMRGAKGNAIIPDPFTGLNRPQRLESAVVYAQTGLPIGVTLDWVTLEFMDEIAVPDDAWSDWDAVNQVWITAAERFVDEPATAKTKVVMTYEADFPGNTTWHDGSPFTIADMVMGMIMTFDLSLEDSPMYDEGTVPAFTSFMSSFKGWKIASTDPVVVEYYTDAYQLDAELNITNFRAAFPNEGGLYDQGSAAWHNIVPAWLAEANGEMAFSDDKAAALEVDQTNYLAGPTVEIMETKLDEALASAYIPYEPTLGVYITAEEATARYENLKTWIDRTGHVYLGTGLFYIQKAFPVEGTIIMQRNPNHPDMADRWAQFAMAPIPDVLVDGPGEVAAGDEAVFDVFVDFQGEPYINADLDMVTYLVFDATGALASKGDAVAVEDGYFQVILSSDVTAELTAGSNKLAVIAVSKNALLPVLETFEFVTTE
jgi:peptide/nickel transport system substrate-binding protein